MIELLVEVFHSVSVSIGVGASTLALVFYFCAIADGDVDEGERRSLGIIYTVLRIAMGLILFFFTLISIIIFNYFGFEGFLRSNIAFEWLLIFVLYGNAVLMTFHLMPMKVGPALQASTWYTLGFMMALFPFTLSFPHYLIFYAGFTIFAIVTVEAIRQFVTRRQKKT